MSFIVAIDGPAGTGKGTITKLIEQELGLLKIDTGVTYRCVALEVLKEKVSLEEKSSIIEIANKIKIDIQNVEGNTKVKLNDEDVTSQIRSIEVNKIVSEVSSIKEVRFAMVDIQRKLAQGKDVIMEGRDITTYVFPNADVKIYLDAKVEERAKRRQKENQEKGINSTYEEVLENVKKRDKDDMEKEIGALKIAPDAIYIDTTSLTIEEVKNKILDIIKSKWSEK